MRVRNSLVFGVLAGAAVFALSACDNQDPIAAGTTNTTPATSTTGVSKTAAPTKTTKTTPAASPAADKDGCPVTASTLQKASGLDKGWKINSGTIKCDQNWATAGLTAPTPEQQGDGVMVFQHRDGKWTKKGEGSSLLCSEWGMPASSDLCTNA
ncbi:hypothetical protein [Actinoplanes palleronii]|uniref:Secreted protein n=1 Tax=Actinoplanes palleronii TaxID=113570 RepID=A0ABQ4BE63_9ACTN|nr:hypothetical protein [Actinoplanes palleronii]GIE68973.1 hypothetical protein Apa02nite_050810 [Actinoplanes palleronii]